MALKILARLRASTPRFNSAPQAAVLWKVLPVTSPLFPLFCRQALISPDLLSPDEGCVRCPLGSYSLGSPFTNQTCIKCTGCSGNDRFCFSGGSRLVTCPGGFLLSCLFLLMLLSSWLCHVFLWCLFLFLMMTVFWLACS